MRGAALSLDPCIPRAWRGFESAFRYHSARYEIAVENPHGVTQGVSSVELDGAPLTDSTRVPLIDDGAIHHVRVVLGR